MHPMSRRRSLLAAVLAAGVTTLAGCGAERPPVEAIRRTADHQAGVVSPPPRPIWTRLLFRPAELARPYGAGLSVITQEAADFSVTGASAGAGVRPQPLVADRAADQRHSGCARGLVAAARGGVAPRRARWVLLPPRLVQHAD
ncbi:hypothetical protein [Actinoplanes sp. NPDC049316]|uniref:hypothetical protein n=1 Tax=Actinoplanes sp. NPDC049316 TaxID=3154727 RepID=UPI00342757DF